MQRFGALNPFVAQESTEKGESQIEMLPICSEQQILRMKRISICKWKYFLCFVCIQKDECHKSM